MSPNGFVRMFAASPALRFGVLGAALFALDAWRARAADERVIAISPAFSAALREGLRRDRGREPTRDELAAREQEHLRDEALYRYALALGLHRGDDIVRRRLVQKARYLLEAQSEPPPPSDRALRQWLAAHPDPAEGRRITLEHRYFRRAPEGDAGAGDPFLRGDRFVDVTADALDGIFGEGFAARATALAPRVWAGPVRSAHGWHLLRWTETLAAQGDPLLRGRRRAERGWREAERTRRAEDALRALVAGYRLVRE